MPRAAGARRCLRPVTGLQSSRSPARLPGESGPPPSAVVIPDLAGEMAARCEIAALASTIHRWLAADALKPWQHRSWISVRDPGFAAKAARVLPGDGKATAAAGDSVHD